MGGGGIGRPTKNEELLIGRAGRNAIESEDIARKITSMGTPKANYRKIQGN